MTCRPRRWPPLGRVFSTLPGSGPSATVCERPDAPGVVGCFRFAMRSNPARTPPALTHSGFWAGADIRGDGTEDTPYLDTGGPRGGQRPNERLALAECQSEP